MSHVYTLLMLLLYACPDSSYASRYIIHGTRRSLAVPVHSVCTEEVWSATISPRTPPPLPHPVRPSSSCISPRSRLPCLSQPRSTSSVRRPLCTCLPESRESFLCLVLLISRFISPPSISQFLIVNHVGTVLYRL